MASSLQALPCAMLLLLIAAPHACMAFKTTLQESCERYAGGDRVSYDYCVRTLRRHNGSAAADELGLAAIAVRIARATAMATAARIAGLQADRTIPAARRGALAKCAREYAATVRGLAHAAADARFGDVQRAQALLAEASGATARCDAAFKAAGERTALNGPDRGLDDQIELAVAILPPPRSPASRT